MNEKSSRQLYSSFVCYKFALPGVPLRRLLRSMTQFPPFPWQDERWRLNMHAVSQWCWGNIFHIYFRINTFGQTWYLRRTWEVEDLNGVNRWRPIRFALRRKKIEKIWLLDGKINLDLKKISGDHRAKILTVSRKLTKSLTISRKSQHPIENLQVPQGIRGLTHRSVFQCVSLHESNFGHKLFKTLDLGL